MKYGVARNIANVLKANGVEYFFFVTGGDQPFWIALKEAGIKLVLARSEASAVYMADAYARITKKPGLVYGQWGPGAANVAAALADPYWAHSPVVALTSTVRTSAMTRNDYQELDQLAMFAPVTKWNKAVVRPERVISMVQAALRVAVDPSPRPTHLDIPRDILETDGDLVNATLPVLNSQSQLLPGDGEIRHACDFLSKARKPLILAGNGAVLSGATAELAQLMREFRIPVATSGGGKGAVSEAEPLAIGVVGRYSRAVGNPIVAEADCVLVVGSDLGGQVTNGYKIPSQDARIIQIDVEANALGYVRPIDLAIQADAKLTLQALLKNLATVVSPKNYADWSDLVQKKIQKWKNDFDAEFVKASAASPLQPAAVFGLLNKKLAPQDIVVADTGYMSAWASALFTVREPGRNFLRAAGSLGWSFPASLGAQLAAPNARVVCITGDGGFGYHVGDLETALRCKIPAIIIVLNNSSLAFEYHMQKFHYDVIVPEVNDFADTNYAAIANAYGIGGAKVRTMKELESTLAEAYSTQKPYVIDVVVDKESYAPVTAYDAISPRIL